MILLQALALGLVSGTALASTPTSECVLIVHEYVSTDGESYTLGQSRLLLRKPLTRSKNIMTGSYPPIAYRARLQPDGSIQAVLKVKLDQYSDRQERIAFNYVTVNVEDVFGNFKDSYVLECRTLSQR